MVISRKKLQERNFKISQSQERRYQAMKKPLISKAINTYEDYQEFALLIIHGNHPVIGRVQMNPDKSSKEAILHELKATCEEMVDLYIKHKGDSRE